MHVNIQNIKKWGMFSIDKKKFWGFKCIFMKNTLKFNKNNKKIHNFHNFFLTAEFKYTNICNHLNNYDNLNECSLHSRFTSI